MEFGPIERAPGAFQQSVSAEQIQAMCRRRRAFGAGARVSSATELGLGAYNSTYRVALAGHRPVILPHGAEHRAFFDSYGPLPDGANDRVRAAFYLARHLFAVRLERFRLGDSELSATYDDVREVLAGLA